MSKLGDLLNKRKLEKEPVQKKETQKVEELNIYNRLWLKKKAEAYGYIVSDNDQKVTNILKALGNRDGHCPCGGMTEEFVCPCRMMKEHGVCKCGLYRDLVDVKPSGNTSGAKIK